MFCKNCGREIKRQTVKCPYCGGPTVRQTSYTYTLDEETEQTNKVSKNEKFKVSVFAINSLVFGVAGVVCGVFGMFELIPFVIFAGVASLGGFVCSLIGLNETLKLYKNGIILSYIGFFLSAAGIFLTVASILIKTLGG